MCALNSIDVLPVQGVGGEAIYIDTEGSFMVERVLQMASAVMKHLVSICKHHSRPAQLAAVEALSGSAFPADGSAFLRGIHVMRVHDHTEQLAAIHALPALLSQYPRGE